MATKAEDFNEWYNEVVDRSGLRDKRYPVKGMDVWTPYGWAAMTRIDNLMRAEMERTGHGEVNFPPPRPGDGGGRIILCVPDA